MSVFYVRSAKLFRIRSLIFICFAFFIFLSPCISLEVSKPDIEDMSWRYLQKASISLKAKHFDQCLKECQAAKLHRKNEVAYEVSVLQKALKPLEVEKAGDLIADVIEVLKKRNSDVALQIINYNIDLHGKDFFDDSISNLLDFVKSRENYPEIDFLLSEVYFFEGEYNLAKQYLNVAYDNSALLDIPDVKFDILYSLAEISFVNDDYENYEKYLTMVTQGDKELEESGLGNALLRTIDTNDTGSVEKFFSLYRAKNRRMLKAYEKLSEVYEYSGKHEKALMTIAFAALTSFTEIYNVVKERNINFTYTGTIALFKEASRYDDIVSWGIENDVWKCFYLLAEYADKRGRNTFATTLYTVIATSFPEEYWRNKATTQLTLSASKELYSNE